MIEIKIDDSEFRKAMEELIRKGATLRPLMRNIAGIMHNAVEDNFAQEGRPRWSPLSAKTVQSRAKRGYWPGKILQMRGQLAASISSRHTENTAEVGTNLVYAGIHQFGGKAGRGRKVDIPARPFLKLTEQDIEDIKQAVIDYLKK